MSGLPPSVNFHFWQPCNMACAFCFAGFEDVRDSILPRGHLPRGEALRLTSELARTFEKVTFVGGEPTLCPWLAELIGCAKAHGATTMIVTNGTRLTSTYLAQLRGLDWVTISMDSANPATHAAMGRAVRGKSLPQERYIEIADAVRAAGMRLKLNTVVGVLVRRERDFEWSAESRPARKLTASSRSRS